MRLEGLAGLGGENKAKWSQMGCNPHTSPSCFLVFAACSWAAVTGSTGRGWGRQRRGGTVPTPQDPLSQLGVKPSSVVELLDLLLLLLPQTPCVGAMGTHGTAWGTGGGLPVPACPRFQVQRQNRAQSRLPGAAWSLPARREMPRAGPVPSGGCVGVGLHKPGAHRAAGDVSGRCQMGPVSSLAPSSMLGLLGQLHPPLGTRAMVASPGVTQPPMGTSPQQPPWGVVACADPGSGCQG